MPKPSSLPSSKVLPEPALEKRTRRVFSPDYKLRIITAANDCKHGELGALLRRENLYSNQLQDWRRDYAEHGLKGLGKSAPGPSPSKTPDERKNDQLCKENERLKRKLEMANACLTLQKKALDMLDQANSGSDA